MKVVDIPTIEKVNKTIAVVYILGRKVFVLYHTNLVGSLVQVLNVYGCDKKLQTKHDKSYKVILHV